MSDSPHSSDRKRMAISRTNALISALKPVIQNTKAVTPKPVEFAADFSFGDSDVLSIVIPAKDAERYIVDCLMSISASLLALPDRRVEVIVGLDDCHNTREAINSLASVPLFYDLKVFESKSHCGTYVMLNSLIRKTTGRWVATVGADDTVRPSWVSDIIGAITSDADALAVNTLFETVDEAGRHLDFSSIPPHGCWVYRRDYLFNALGAFYYPWRSGADEEMYIRSHFGWRAKEVIANVPSYRYRRHAGQVTDLRKMAITKNSPERTWRRDFIEAERQRYQHGEPPFIPNGAATTYLTRVRLK